MLLTLRVASIHPVIRPQAGRSEATEPKPWFVLLMRSLNNKKNTDAANKAAVKKAQADEASKTPAESP